MTPQNAKETIRKQFEQMGSISEDDWAYFSNRLHYRAFNKKEIVTRYGEVEKYLYFLIDGVVRFTINNDAGTTSDFAFPNEFFSSYSSFISRNPSVFEITLITKKIECFYLSYEGLQEIFINTQCGERIGRLAAEQLFLKKSAREVALLTQTPTEKYMGLLREQKHLLHSIPLKYLASYLGITPETLSRIRSSIS